ncbi:putative xaa-Pro aminopeptidase [Helianthus annuus]|uniref:Xaa-Pro aminopeptidase n=1 Tax=Helianthus annuus TaxID=4232 RepID=A0A9K3P369_HELAN|nr:putative xaa-Pro aminopeptidase [Helianthus annuus]KAJ0611863.1 putative xaa-Pro aminopeptidase [Helianthus annuus]KAJ0627220.1 putative xaa-Pro aminopeptidase [Helianthus annuus]KAJ0783533.1 putative xaa-Pro aminopeptidase [Helianthus annuus]KAJ0810005.1 putative xaa-Pro aminopeptidase [Helianthus annuus]
MMLVGFESLYFVLFVWSHCQTFYRGSMRYYAIWIKVCRAEKQLSSSWTLMRSGSSGVPSTAEWLNDVLAPGSRIDIDPGAVSFFF